MFSLTHNPKLRAAVLYAAIGLLTIGAAGSAAADSTDTSANTEAEASPSSRHTPAQRFLMRLLPRQIQLGPEVGLLGSRFTASNEYRALIEPTEARKNHWTSPSFGLSATARWKHGITVTIAPRHETYGLESKEEEVSFPNNPFPHTLKSRTEASYMVWPLIIGMGWETRRQHVRAQLGVFRALLDEAEVEWTVDGEPYDNEPPTQFEDEFGGWLMGVEYGVRMGPGELVVGAETHRGTNSMMSGLEGSLKSQGARLRAGYLWTVFSR